MFENVEAFEARILVKVALAVASGTNKSEIKEERLDKNFTGFRLRVFLKFLIGVFSSRGDFRA